MNVETALNKLYSLHSFGIKLGLENISNFLEFIGNPQQHLKTFHIAGSNGKGSTSSFIASILMEFGNKVGLYTSPHFVKFNERIVINNNQIPDDYIAKFITEFVDYIDKNKLTFFEVTTAIAFKYFFEQNVNYAVIETGLGGRLDATNVLTPLAVVLTSISLEHTNILGNTISDIAGEKVAIIKNHSKVFTGKLPSEAEKVVEKRCNETNSTWYKIEDYINVKNELVELYTEEVEIDNWNIPLRGEYQKFNAALAGLVVSKTLLKNDFKPIMKGIENVIKNTGLQGRFEYYSKEPDIIFDSAHNPEGIENFLLEFQKDLSKYQKKVLLFGVMKDKSIKEMLLNLKNFFDEIHITEINYERSSKIDELQRIAGELNLKVIPEYDSIKFFESFKGEKRENCLVILGSMYLLGEIKSSLH
ncbi:MAG: bifunctional folylpolyglutamate synthase/dihydrofolate synthase [Bacteroidetes bacterium]|nr:bifunctional folylpolyglutamate synthase/dihydrofolate synthase [Bacteroidota bacterium]